MTGDFSLAVHALVYLDHKQTHLTSVDLAENICTNPARVRKVMARLKKAGCIATKEGFEGGYALRADPARLTLAQVARGVEANFVEAGWRPGSQEMDCLVASGMAAVMDGIYADLQAQCMQRLETITIRNVSDEIFGGPSAREGDRP